MGAWKHFTRLINLPFIQTILSASESHRVCLAARGLYHRWGISPRPKENSVVTMLYHVMWKNARILRRFFLTIVRSHALRLFFWYKRRMSEFSKRLKCLRTENRFTQIKVAKNLGVSSCTVSRWENGLQEPSLIRLVEIAYYYQVSCAYLIGQTDSKTPIKKWKPLRASMG